MSSLQVAGPSPILLPVPAGSPGPDIPVDLTRANAQRDLLSADGRGAADYVRTYARATLGHAELVKSGLVGCCITAGCATVLTLTAMKAKRHTVQPALEGIVLAGIVPAGFLAASTVTRSVRLIVCKLTNTHGEDAVWAVLTGALAIGLQYAISSQLLPNFMGKVALPYSILALGPPIICSTLRRARISPYASALAGSAEGAVISGAILGVVVGCGGWWGAGRGIELMQFAGNTGFCLTGMSLGTVAAASAVVRGVGSMACDRSHRLSDEACLKVSHVLSMMMMLAIIQHVLGVEPLWQITGTAAVHLTIYLRSCLRLQDAVISDR